jgi:hypothetical protein
VERGRSGARSGSARTASPSSAAIRAGSDAVKARTPVTRWYPTAARLNTSDAGETRSSPRNCSGDA